MGNGIFSSNSSSMFNKKMRKTTYAERHRPELFHRLRRKRRFQFIPLNPIDHSYLNISSNNIFPIYFEEYIQLENTPSYTSQTVSDARIRRPY